MTELSHMMHSRTRVKNQVGHSFSLAVINEVIYRSDRFEVKGLMVFGLKVDCNSS